MTSSQGWKPQATSWKAKTAFGEQKNIAGERDLQPAGHGVSVHRRHNRLVDLQVAGDAAEAVTVGIAAAELGARASREGHGVGLEISVGTERLVSHPGQHRHAGLVLAVEAFEGGDQRLVSLNLAHFIE